ncbi:MAG: hypothetical protein BWK75_05485 [Candidatus Altiarchaeales archaeon A3]|nr:MAG: hypothetical protein BWK75_05485 [Candidatus Altiarchaeales archaeon A3]
MQEQDYRKSLSYIIKKVEDSKHRAITTVNKLLIDLYWFIGETIVDLQEKNKWGEGVVEKLSVDLRMKYPDMNGFSVRNLWNMKRFYTVYGQHEKLQALPAEISWTNNVVILEKTKTMGEKEFYLKMCLKERWSSRDLIRQIDSAYFERFMLSKNTDKLIKIEVDKIDVPLEDIHRHLKDDYMLEFLDLSKTFSEKELRKGILNNLRTFFLEFGKNLTFVGEEYPLIVDDEIFKIDLLFFHRELRCLVAVELKIGEFKPEYVGKMQFYLAALDEQIKIPSEKLSIGLILCRSKKENVVRLTLSKTHEPIKISVYQTKLPDKKIIQKQLERIKLPEKLHEE